jgi:kinetochore protein Spc7/SPC105
MDFTRDIRGSINDNATRKSLGRRVSFASHAQVRVFEKDPNRGDASPSIGADPGPSAQSGTVVNDENDYPGASVLRRRSSLRRSIAFSENGEASMEMDSDLGSSPLPTGFLVQGSFLQDEEPEDVSGIWDEQADMDLTTNLPATRPRSSSLGLSSLSRPGEDMSIDDHSLSEDMTQDSADDVSGEQPEPTEFTVPLSKSLRKSEPPSAEWLALRAITHAGADGPYEPPSSDMGEDEPVVHERSTHLGEEDMDLTEAETRLRRMRESLGLANVAQEDSFTSSEGSSISGGDNQTVNLTNVWRDSLGTDSSSAMDFTNIQGTSRKNSTDEAVNRALSPVLALQNQRAISEQQESRVQPGPSGSTSGTPLVNATDSLQDPPAPPTLPVFTKPGPVFSAPKQAPPSHSKPKSPASPRKTSTAAFVLPVERPQPKKRAAPPDVDGEDFEGERSPVKGQPHQRSSPKPTSATTLTEGVATFAARRSSVGGLRRPSGYFAQRKSLGPSGALNIPQQTSPRKKVARGRTSEADISGMDQSTVNFGRENVEPSPSLPHPQLTVEDPPQGSSLSGADDPPLPVPPSLFVVNNSVPSAKSEAPATHPTVTFANVDAAEQWRNNVQPPSFTEEDEDVRILFIILCQKSMLTLR